MKQRGDRGWRKENGRIRTHFRRRLSIWQDESVTLGLVADMRAGEILVGLHFG